MQLTFKFRGLKHSQDLVDFALERFEKLKKFETKPVSGSVTLSVEKRVCTVKVLLNGREIQIRASAQGENFYDAIEKVIPRCERQLSRKKAKVQNHKVPSRTREHWLEHLDSTLTPPEAGSFDEAA